MRRGDGWTEFLFMFLRCNRRQKDGKDHACWSVMDDRLCSDGHVAQCQVLYLGQDIKSGR